MLDLSSKVMLINLSISVFSGEKVDKAVSDDVAAQHNTTARDAGRFSKQIIGKHSLEAIKGHAGAARLLHYQRTLPWSDLGGRLLSVAGYMDYCNAMRQVQAAFTHEVDRFIDAYPSLIEDARTRLNGMFNIDDYPAVSALRERFSFEVGASPLPSGKNWFLDMADGEMEALRRHADQRLAHSIDEAVRDTYRRVADVTSKMAHKLNEYDPKEKKGIFRDSLVENIRELAGLLPVLNITDDPRLSQLGRDLAQLTKHSATALREDHVFREEAATRAQQVYEMASSFM